MGPAMTLRRRTPLRRVSMRRGQSSTAYARRDRDFDYMGLVKQLPCLLEGVDGAGYCDGAVEADHAGLDRGLSQKADDTTCIPLCRQHHRDRTESTGLFAALTKDERRAWRRWAIGATTLRVAERRAGLR
jgi:hypothetical protein